MVTVIADDITGAAEIAGIALRHNLRAVLTTSFSSLPSNTDVFVIATNTRSGDETSASATNAELIKSIRQASVTNDGDIIIFKKTDSVLRGHVAAELRAIMNADTLFTCALLLPQNPSKSRIISGCKYFIGGTPLNETDFKNDPEFPATSASVTALLGNKAESLSLCEQMKHDGSIMIADATNEDEIKIQLEKSGSTTLLAGGADLFNALLQKIYPDNNHKGQQPAETSIQPVESAIIFCGSTQSKSLTEEEYIKQINAQECEMPDDVFHGGDTTLWFNTLTATYLSQPLIVSIGKKENGGSHYAVRLRKTMAVAAQMLISKQQPDLLIIEGGATAYSILESLGWTNFIMKHEYGPGVVSMTYDKTEIILKPGSYPWGDLFK